MNWLHEFCVNAVRWAGSCPEATVGTWIVSGILMVVQGVLLARRFIFNKQPEQVMVISKPEVRPYVPSDTILKLLKLMNLQETGWTIENDGVYSSKKLKYGNLKVTSHCGTIIVEHGHTTIDLANRSKRPELDQRLLNEAFDKRFSTETTKLKTKSIMQAQEAEKTASRMLDSILETI